MPPASSEQRAWLAAESAAVAEVAADAAAWVAGAAAARAAGEDATALERMVAISMPLVDAFEAGLWLWWVSNTGVIAVERPAP